MFTYVYYFTYYRFIKSGMLLDFFFKKYIYYNLYFLFYVFNIKFSEKYFIEYSFLRLNRVYSNIKLLTDYFSTQAIIWSLVHILWIISLILLFINL